MTFLKTYASAVFLSACAIVCTPSVGYTQDNHDENAEMRGVFEETRDIVSRLRSLAPKRPVQWKWVSGRELISVIRKSVERTYTPGELVAEGDLYKRMGLIPESMNYVEDMFSLLEQQVAGLYEPEEEILYVNRDMGDAVEESTLAHELAHALVDQHFELDSVLDRKSADGDALLARSALMEGDATLITLRYMLAKGIPAAMDSESMAMYEDLKNYPRFIIDSLLFPYTAGMFFVTSMMNNPDDWETVDAAYSMLPDSTEHILHPEKYTSGEKPVRITTRELPVLSGSYTAVFEEVLGEFILSEYLMTHGKRTDARGVAGGWGGDAVVLYRPAGAELITSDMLVSLSVWDRYGTDGMDEAREFAEAIINAQEMRYDSEAIKCPGHEAYVIPVSRDTSSVVLRQGSRVILVDKAPRDTAMRTAYEVLEKWRVRDEDPEGPSEHDHQIPLM